MQIFNNLEMNVYNFHLIYLPSLEKGSISAIIKMIYKENY